MSTEYLPSCDTPVFPRTDAIEWNCSTTDGCYHDADRWFVYKSDEHGLDAQLEHDCDEQADDRTGNRLAIPRPVRMSNDGLGARPAVFIRWMPGAPLMGRAAVRPAAVDAGA